MGDTRPVPSHGPVDGPPSGCDAVDERGVYVRPASERSGVTRMMRTRDDFMVFMKPPCVTGARRARPLLGA